MIRHFNYTGRQKIKREDVTLTLQDGDPHSSFDLHFDLAGYGLAPDARVYVEASRKTRYMRFPWGTVASPIPAPDRRLTAFDSADSVKFRLKVTGTDTENGKLLAAAENLRPEEPEERDARRRPLLPVKSEPLNGPLWRVDFEGTETILLIDDRVEKEEVANNSAFIAAVYPSALREILQRIYVEEFTGDYNDAETEDWEAQWLKFAVRQLMADEPPIRYDDTSDREEYFEWVEDVVSRFSRAHNVVDLSLSTWNGEDT
ncbi:MAG: hypothetical protein ACPGJU_07900 [Coraliomargarita sp.]